MSVKPLLLGGHGVGHVSLSSAGFFQIGAGLGVDGAAGLAHLSKVDDVSLVVIHGLLKFDGLPR